VFKKVDKQFKRIDPIDFFRLVADGSIQAPTGLRITQ
jgi:hypothetical protein